MIDQLYNFSHTKKIPINNNAVMESFYRTLKRELVQDDCYDNPEQARMEISKYIETYYNAKRIHSASDWLSPEQFELQNCQKP